MCSVVHLLVELKRFIQLEEGDIVGDDAWVVALVLEWKWITEGAFERIFMYNQHPEVVFGYFSAFPFQEFLIEFHIRQNAVFSYCFVMSHTFFANPTFWDRRTHLPCSLFELLCHLQYIFCQNPIQYFEREVPKGQHICGHFQYKLPVQTVLSIKMV